MKSPRLTADPEAAASSIRACQQRLLKRCTALEGGKVVGVEPSGEAFNSISLEPGTGHRHRPPREPRVLEEHGSRVDVRVDNKVECALLRAEDFAPLEHERQALMIRLLQGLLRSVNDTAQRLTREAAALEG